MDSSRSRYETSADTSMTNKVRPKNKPTKLDPFRNLIGDMYQDSSYKTTNRHKKALASLSKTEFIPIPAPPPEKPRRLPGSYGYDPAEDSSYDEDDAGDQDGDYLDEMMKPGGDPGPKSGARRAGERGDYSFVPTTTSLPLHPEMEQRGSRIIHKAEHRRMALQEKGSAQNSSESRVDSRRGRVPKALTGKNTAAWDKAVLEKITTTAYREPPSFAYDPFKGPALAMSDFLQSTGGNTGGWDHEYHNIFVQVYTRYRNRPDMILDIVGKRIPEKNPGDIASHIAWFEKYLRLHEEHRKYVDLWQERHDSKREPSLYLKIDPKRKEQEQRRNEHLEMLKNHREAEKARERMNLYRWKRVEKKKLEQEAERKQADTQNDPQPQGIRGAKSTTEKVRPPGRDSQVRRDRIQKKPAETIKKSDEVTKKSAESTAAAVRKTKK